MLAALADFLIAGAILGIVLAATGRGPELEALALPLLVVIMFAATLGVGLLLASLGARYRDVRYATPFLVQLLLFLSPVIYAAEVVPEPWRYAYALNPMVGVIEGFRASLLGTTAFPWALVGIGAASSLVLLALGIRVFSRTARYFADLA
jgi:lipopolysaccharide transport system permease protein